MPMTAESFAVARELISESLGGFLPEIVLSLFVCILFLHDVVVKNADSRRPAYIALFGLVLTGIALLQSYGAAPRDLFGWKEGEVVRGMVRQDGFGWFFKAFVLSGTIVVIPMCLAWKGFRGRRMGEFYAMLLGATLGMFVMCGASNLLMIYLGIEFASMGSYLLTAFVKRDLKASEAGLKYVIYGSVASGVMIYGLSLVYGMTGSLHLAAIADQLNAGVGDQVALLVAGVLVFAGFAYKMSAAPMHFWCPDVYQGAAVPFTAYLSVTSKAAGFAVFIRFLMSFGPDFRVTFEDFGGVIASFEAGWPEIVGAAAALSMTIGNLAALWQTNVKRMLAYSSIAHAGYLLMGVAVLQPGTTGANEQMAPLVFYFIAYFFMNLGAFYIATVMSSRLDTEEVDGYRGLGQRSPFLAACMTLFLISLIGIPPTGGFTGKFQLLEAVIDGGMVWLAIVAGINTAISAYYYARFWKAMYLEGVEDASPVTFSLTSRTMIALLAVPVLILGLAFGGVAEFTRQITL